MSSQQRSNLGILSENKVYKVFIGGIAQVEGLFLFKPNLADIVELIDLKISANAINAGMKQMVSLGMPVVEDKEGSYVKDYYFGGRNLGKLVVSVRPAYAKRAVPEVSLDIQQDPRFSP